MQRIRAAVRIFRKLDGQELAATEQVQLFQLDPAGILAAASAESDAGIGRPDLVHGHFEIDRPVMAVDGAH
ncbi:hypothetical protein D3C83_216660 [compost metagenome]